MIVAWYALAYVIVRWAIKPSPSEIDTPYFRFVTWVLSPIAFTFLGFLFVAELLFPERGK